MNILDLGIGLGGATKPFADQGHRVVGIDREERFNPTICADILDLTADEVSAYGPFDFIWASPPCQSFSVMTISRCWTRDGQPKASARAALRLVGGTLSLIQELRPRAWVMENPVGMLRVQDVVRPYERRTVTYCRYGMPYRKATDLWGGFPPTLRLRPMCSPGSRCHEANPRGTEGGVQGKSNLAGGAMAFEYHARHGTPYLRGEAPYIRATRSKDGMQAASLGWIRKAWEELSGDWTEARRSQSGRAALRSLVPYDLGLTICEAMERWNGASWEDSTLKPWLEAVP